MASEFSFNLVSGSSLVDGPLRIFPQSEIKIGREVGDYTYPSDFQMSTSHFSIKSDGQTCTVIDVGSTNGTYVNGERITMVTVRNRDLVRAGQTSWEVSETRIEESRQPVREYTDWPSEKPGSGRVSADSSRYGESSHAYDQEAALAGAGGQFDDRLPVATGPISLILRTAGQADKSVSQQSRLSVGRTDLSQWSFEEDSSMSSRHFEVYFENGSWTLSDLGSTNGTMVNGVKISQIAIGDGDVVQAGKSLFDVIVQSRPVDADRIFDTDFGNRNNHANVPRSSKEPPSSEPTQTQSQPAVKHPDWLDKTLFDIGPHAGMLSNPDGLANRQHNPSAILHFEFSDGTKTYSILGDGDRVIVGRSSESNMVIAKDPMVSGRHAIVAFRNGEVEISDLHSTNGTFVNDQRVESSPLHHGDIVRVGRSLVRILLDHGTHLGSAVELPRSEIGSTVVQEPLPSPNLGGTVSSPAPNQIPNDSCLPTNPDPVANADQMDSATDADKPSTDESGSNDVVLSSDEAVSTSVIEIEIIKTTASVTSVASFPKTAISASSNLLPELQFEASKMEPDCAARLLLEKASGWLVDIERAHGWLQSGGAEMLRSADTWITLAKTDEVTWMVSLLDHWGKESQWMVFGVNQLAQVRNRLIELMETVDPKLPLRTWSEALFTSFRAISATPTPSAFAISAVLRDDQNRIAILTGETKLIETVRQLK